MKVLVVVCCSVVVINNVVVVVASVVVVSSCVVVVASRVVVVASRVVVVAIKVVVSANGTASAWLLSDVGGSRPRNVLDGVVEAAAAMGAEAAMVAALQPAAPTLAACGHENCIAVLKRSVPGGSL